MGPGNPHNQHTLGQRSGSQRPESTLEEEEERVRRRRALSELAHHSGSAPSDASTAVASVSRGSSEHPTGFRPSRPRWFFAALAVLALASVAALLLPRLLTPAQRHASLVITIDPGPANLGCAEDAAWSPNGDFIAVLGYQTICPNTDPAQMYESGQANVYNAKTGKLVTSLLLDPPILHTHKVTLAPVVASGALTPIIGYQCVVWSPDGKQLAFPFVVLQQPYTFPVPAEASQPVSFSPPTQAGVLLINLPGTASQVDVAPYAVSKTALAPSMEWNVQTGKLVSAALILPPALSYKWANNGTLLPRQRLNTSTAPAAVSLAAVGNPIGGKTFTHLAARSGQPGLLFDQFCGEQWDRDYRYHDLCFWSESVVQQLCCLVARRTVSHHASVLWRAYGTAWTACSQFA